MDDSNASDPSTVYIARAQSGLYDSAVDQIVALPRGTALAMSTYEEDFTRVTNNWSGNFSYHSTGSNNEHESILIGQLCHSSSGTKFTARGNHYVGTGFNPIYIEDKSRVKFIFTLSRPSHATPRMQTLWDNQVATLNEVIDADRAELTKRNKTLPFKEWTDHSTGDKSLPPDLINILSGQIYVIECDSGMQDVDSKFTVADTPPSPPITNIPTGTFAITHTDEITINDLYNPSILSDYGGDLFRHDKAMLRQLDMRDLNNDLVPPDAWYSTFRPGCLIMARVTMHAFSWESRRVYQLNAHSLRLLDSSIEPIEERLCDSIHSTSPASLSSSTAASTAMASFSLGKRTRD
ncbi:hypothetical protein BV22DRAFT_1066428 [Leucogyrophana mollusca]|uniref:Uncharacterized protein n=1 Tax=Leucogyrophana mollusca TaxID=85980 RepID=A0ACB8BFJ6_9AGAM|nr:hypothetical protein BV22DRAFT_1066428 [Leucogyrophana mollusca]